MTDPQSDQRSDSAEAAQQGDDFIEQANQSRVGLAGEFVDLGSADFLYRRRDFILRQFAVFVVGAQYIAGGPGQARNLHRPVLGV